MTQRADRIAASVARILAEVPADVTVVAAAKGHPVAEVEAAIQAGIRHVGHNYVQEAQPMVEVLGAAATWHMIGHLQRNKAAAACQIFDVVQTVDSRRLVAELERRCAEAGRAMPVLIEVNSGREAAKTGAVPEAIDDLALAVAQAPHLELQGLMTMGPRFGDPEDARPYFRRTRLAFESLARSAPSAPLPVLSMGMTNSYRVAIEEGATMVRIGTAIFGQREPA